MGINEILAGLTSEEINNVRAINGEYFADFAMATQTKK